MKWEKANFELSAGLASQLPEPVSAEVAFSGRSNVGKSSLINCLLGRKSLARTSATPGKTATVNFYCCDGIRLVDLPGYGYAKVSTAEKKRWSDLIMGYFNADRDLRLVLQLLDIRHAPSAEDRQMMDSMAEMEIPFVVVLTKADKLNVSERNARLAAFADELADYEGVTCIPFSALTGEGTDILREIVIDVTEEE